VQRNDDVADGFDALTTAGAFEPRRVFERRAGVVPDILFGVRFEADATTRDVPASVLAALSDDDRRSLEGLTPLRRVERAAGRVAKAAARRALQSAAAPASVSHKNGIAVAYASIDGSASVGVDLEEVFPGAAAIERRVLGDDERRALDAADDSDRDAAVLLRFAVKEAVYKAVHPIADRDDLTFRSLGASMDLAEARRRFAPVDLRWRIDFGPEISCEAEVALAGTRILALARARRR
jgi:4'-phosphopantetheinyl transferase EntD